MTKHPLVQDGNLLTVGGENDPLLHKLLFAIEQATEINIAVSFIRHSGLALLLPKLKAVLGDDQREQPVKCRILTSDYLHITEAKALKNLLSLASDDCEIRIFESHNENKSFHLKSYIFVRRDDLGESGAAFIGSNNISKTALTDAHEWCLRVDVLDNDSAEKKSQFQTLCREFDVIFNHRLSIPLTSEWIKRYQQQQPVDLQKVLAKESKDNEFSPNSAQLEALQALTDTRAEGFTAGLVVLATGMGKTWLSAFDAKQMNAKRILFVAHREEILSQALQTYGLLWPEKTTGFYHGSAKQADKEMLFASVQTLGREHHLKRFNHDDFDYIVVDEFHHASSKTYRNILRYFEPKFMLGLTATPERSDQADILSLCANNLVYERHLVDGINSQILVPFHYYGTWDEYVNYAEIPWRNGNFDPKAMEAEVATVRRAKHVLGHWALHQQTRTLAFCVSTKHADFMAEQFNQRFSLQGFTAVSVHSQSSVDRQQSLNALDKGDISIIFCVDIFNEGTDLPAIDTVLMLRPTESSIIFLQQLGRGLRSHTDKTHLVVIDFIGNHKRFLDKADLLGISATSETGEGVIERQTPTLGKGCHVTIDPKVIAFLEEIKKVYATPLEVYQQLFDHLGREPTLTEYYRKGFSLKKVNNKQGSWFEMVASLSEDNTLINVVKKHKEFLLFLQTTPMTKCFKAILLEAFLSVDGFTRPPTLARLAEKSWHILDRYPQLKEREIAKSAELFQAADKGWLNYWKNNPIKAFTEGSVKKTCWFELDGDFFKAKLSVTDDDRRIVEGLVQEIVDYRLAQYSDRQIKNEKPTQTSPEPPVNVVSLGTTQTIEQSVSEGRKALPYFPNIKIACGHFKTGRDDDCEMMDVELHNADPQKHFLARASGNSMNGGKTPIHDGDLLLLELLSPDRAGSITGSILVIEAQDAAGDSQYLLRVVEKREGVYWLRANNPTYETMPVQDGFRTLARLKQVVDE